MVAILNNGWHFYYYYWSWYNLYLFIGGIMLITVDDIFGRIARVNGYWMDVKIRSVGMHFVGTWDIFDQVIEDEKVYLCITDGTFLEENGLSL